MTGAPFNALALSADENAALDWILANLTAIRRDNGSLEYTLPQVIRAMLAARRAGREEALKAAEGACEAERQRHDEVEDGSAHGACAACADAIRALKGVTLPMPPLPVMIDRALTPSEKRALHEFMAASAQTFSLVEKPEAADLLRLALRRILAVPIGTKGLAPADRAARLFNAIEDIHRIAKEALKPMSGEAAP